MIAPGFAQAVAGDFPRDINRNHRVMNNPPCLYTGNCFTVLAVACKDIITMTVRKIQLQCKNNLFIQRDSFRFPSLFLSR